MADLMEQGAPKLAAGSPGSSESVQDKTLDEIISEVGSMLANQYGHQDVSLVLNILAAEFQDARITSFLPILILRKASRLLAAGIEQPRRILPRR